MDDDNISIIRCVMSCAFESGMVVLFLPNFKERDVSFYSSLSFSMGRYFMG